jgi:hypothetical protein
MKPISTLRFLLLALSIGIFSCSSSKYASSGSSEYDDLYFNNGDRYPIMTEGTTTVVQGSTDGNVGVGYNSKTLNPDYGLPQDAQNETLYGEDEYYVENHDDAYMDQAVEEYLKNNSTTARRYNSPSYGGSFDDVFWSDPLYYQGTIFDPLYRSYYGVYSPFAYSPYYRPYSSFYRPWGPRVSVNLAFGFGYGSYWGRYYDAFYYGGGFGYGYGYGSPYSRYYYGGSAWCPPSYYGVNNNTVVINTLENNNPGNVRYGTRQPRGSSYIVNNAPRERTSTTTAANSSRIRSRADNTVRSTAERTLNNGRVLQQTQTRDMRTRTANQYDQSDRTRSRFRTHSLDSRSNNYGVNERRSSSSVQQRGRSINSDTYRTPTRDLRTRRSSDRIRSNSTSPSEVSGSRFRNTPSRTPASSGVRSRSNYSRSSAPSRVRSSGSSGSSNFGRSSSGGRVSAPSRSSSYSPSRSSSVGRSSLSPSRSGSIPNRGGGGTKSITR